ncbi:GDSL-type esterase/lipase family protein [Streptomyces sp. NPDC089919]|uniref:GDSL-type esterase/lipase family protein n=1 Tax=Streptomyces sp. NPDC089919 TaxID=3155188 RepID=UPI003426A575
MNARRAVLGVLAAATALLLPAAPGPLLAASPAVAAPAPPTVRVLPLGDSITYGQGSSSGGGYRQPLADLAAGQSRYALDFVGSLVHGPQSDPAHEGHAGYTIDRITAGAGRWIPAARPDVILLHIGINDLNQGADPDRAADRARLLLDRIFELRPSATVLMQGLIGTTPGWDDQDLTGQAARYNHLLKTEEGVQQARGRHFRFFDAPDLTTLRQADPAHPAQMADGLHPNDGGYSRLAGAFFAALEQARTAGWFTGGPAAPDQPRPVTTVHLLRRTPGGGLFGAEGDYAAGRWSGWSDQGAAGLGEVTGAATGAVNRIFAIDGEGRLLENDGDYAAGTWSGWYPQAGAPKAKAVSAASDGSMLHLVVIGLDGRLWNSDRDAASGRWNGWTDHGGTGLRRVASATTADHVNHIVAVDGTGLLVELDADYAAGRWSEWKAAGPDGGFRALDVTAAATDNTLHLGAVGLDGNWYNADGDFDRRAWGGWWNGGGGDLTRIASAAANDVNHVFAVRTDGSVIERDGDYSAGRWNDWATPPGSTPAAALAASFTLRP